MIRFSLDSKVSSIARNIESIYKIFALFNRHSNVLRTICAFQYLSWCKIRNIIPFVPYLSIVTASFPQQADGSIRQLRHVRVSERFPAALDVERMDQPHCLAGIVIHQERKHLSIRPVRTLGHGDQDHLLSIDFFRVCDGSHVTGGRHGTFVHRDGAPHVIAALLILDKVRIGNLSGMSAVEHADRAILKLHDLVFRRHHAWDVLRPVPGNAVVGGIQQACPLHPVLRILRVSGVMIRPYHQRAVASRKAAPRRYQQRSVAVAPHLRCDVPRMLPGPPMILGRNEPQVARLKHMELGIPVIHVLLHPVILVIDLRLGQVVMVCSLLVHRVEVVPFIHGISRGHVVLPFENLGIAVQKIAHII